MKTKILYWILYSPISYAIRGIRFVLLKNCEFRTIVKESC